MQMFNNKIIKFNKGKNKIILLYKKIKNILFKLILMILKNCLIQILRDNKEIDLILPRVHIMKENGLVIKEMVKEE